MQILTCKGWKLIETRTCCGPRAEKWGIGWYTLTLYPTKQRFTIRYQGRHVLTTDLSKLDEAIKDLT